MIIKEADVRTLEMSVRTTNTLRNNGVNTVGEMMGKTKGELYRIEGLGRKGVNEVLDAQSRLREQAAEPLVTLDELIQAVPTRILVALVDRLTYGLIDRERLLQRIKIEKGEG